MAKKKAAQEGGDVQRSANKSEAVRRYAAEHPSAMPREIAVALKQEGLDVSAQFVSQIKYQSRLAGPRRRVAVDPERRAVEKEGRSPPTNWCKCGCWSSNWVARRGCWRHWKCCGSSSDREPHAMYSSYSSRSAGCSADGSFALAGPHAKREEYVRSRPQRIKKDAAVGLSRRCGCML